MIKNQAITPPVAFFFNNLWVNRKILSKKVYICHTGFNNSQSVKYRN